MPLMSTPKKAFVLKESYRGFGSNAIGQMPITAVQQIVKNQGTLFTQTMQNEALSDKQKLGVSFTAGVAGSFIDTASNAIQLHQQQGDHTGKKAWQVAQRLQWKMFRGTTPNALFKEGPFVVGYQVLADKGKEFTLNYTNNETAANIIGGVSAGVITASITQPGAVLRNRMQADLTRKIYKNTLQSIHKIVQEEGVQGLYKGISTRGARVACAIPLYTWYTKTLETMIKSQD